jgi:DUF177 domain-containing protein
MKLRVEEITAEAREIAFLEPEAEINRILDAGPVRDFRVDGPISVTLSYYRAGTEIFLEGRISAATASVCARCAEEFAAPRTRAFRYVLSPRVLDSMGDGGGVKADDVEFTEYEGEEIDLSPPIREQLLLALPTRALCREDCRGLCPRCGANLNQGACGCPQREPDARFAVLRSLKLDRA